MYSQLQYTMTDTFKKEYEAQKENAIKALNNFKQLRNVIEQHHDKFYSEMLSVSPDFELVKKPCKESRTIFINSFPVDTIEVEYNDCEIKYVGKLPTTLNRTSLLINVSEHYTTRRGGWRSTSHGYKVRLQYNYVNGPYYKTGRTVAKKILEIIDDQFTVQRQQEDMIALNERARKELSEKFPYSFIKTNVSIRSGAKTNFTIENYNGTEITLNYYVVDGKIEFGVTKVDISKVKNNVESLVTLLGQIR